MVIVAHPDDIEFSCLARLTLVKAGAEVCYVLVTSGDVASSMQDHQSRGNRDP